MKDKLKALLAHSYVPYSHFPVACIIMTNDNQEWLGVNVENASYKAGLCAEQNALAQVLTHGYKKNDIKEVFLLAKTDKIIKPCFLCRQLLSEYLPAAVKINCYNQEGMIKTYQVQELCPLPFGQADLEGDNDEK